MDTNNLYNDIAMRTNGEIYIGVVGPVRTGKSTFIKNFMELAVMPRIEDENERKRALDELPQSADGKTVMTTQPKFVPAKGVDVAFGEVLTAKVRLIDCVGYMIDGAMGATEDGKARMVKTPWQAEEMTFSEAAELGTRKVIRDHSTIGLVVTSDGDITDLPRPAYLGAEGRVVDELQKEGKPFAVVLNTKTPNAADTLKLRDALAERYGVPVLAVDVLNMSEKDVDEIMSAVLMEFPVKRVDALLPDWMAALDADHPLVSAQFIRLAEATAEVVKMRDAMRIAPLIVGEEVEDCTIGCDLGTGTVRLEYKMQPQLFYHTLGDCCSREISGEFDLLSYVNALSRDAKQVARLKKALEQVEECGYGLVEPTEDEMELAEPEIMKQAGRFGVRLKASAPSLHIMKVDVETEVNPVVGSEQQSEELVKYLLSEFETNPKGIWQTNMFGKSLSSLVNEGLNNKLNAMPKDAPNKMRKTLGRIVNEGKGGMICILL